MRTTCSHGHPRTESNTDRLGRCRQCHRDNARKYRRQYTRVLSPAELARLRLAVGLCPGCGQPGHQCA